MKPFIKISIALLLLLPTIGANAQSTSSEPAVTNLFRLNFLLPGLSYEQKLTQFQTVYMGAFVDYNLQSSSFNGENQLDILFYPTFNATFRQYYNLNKRDRKGKNVALNSANYIAPIYIGRYGLTNPNTDRRWIHGLGAVWGIQRNAPKGFSLDLNFGMSYYLDMQHDAYYAPVEFIAQISLGFWIGGKSR